jgi:ankyrin repeat protein
MAAEEATAALHRAARQGDAVSVARILDEDPGLLSLVWRGETLLTTAVRNGHLDLVRLLLERGAEVNQANGYGATALDYAVGRGHEEIVSILVSSGADPSRKGYRDKTALMSASMGGHVAVIRLLLRSMEDRGLDERDSYGITALCYACFEGHADVLRALLLAGADRTIASNIGTTPLHIALERRHHECVALLQVSTSFVSRPLNHMMAAYSPTGVSMLYGVAPHNLCLCCSGGRAS